MSHADMSLVYEGSAVESGAMDVRDLAPALLAFGNLIEATNRVVNGEHSSAKVQVKTVGAGSFAIGLDVAVEFLKAVRDFLVGPDGAAATNLVTILTGLGASSVGAIGLIKWLRGRKPNIERRERGMVEVEVDGRRIIVDEIVARVAVDVSVRASLERIVAEPLARDGIDAVQLGSKEHTERLEKLDGHAFRPTLDSQSGAFVSRYRGQFSIVSLSFKAGNKWRLNDGRVTSNVTVADEVFLRRVEASEVSFSKGDILVCDVRVESRETPGGLNAESFIERVIEQRKPMRQANLFEGPSVEAQSPPKQPGGN